MYINVCEVCQNMDVSDSMGVQVQVDFTVFVYCDAVRVETMCGYVRGR